METTPTTTWKPSRKWGVLILTGLGTIATSAVTTGWGSDEWLALILLAVTSGSTYLVPNSGSSS